MSIGIKPLVYSPDAVSYNKNRIANSLREISINELLGQSKIRLDVEEISSCIKNKTVLVTGAAGSIGTELCRQVAFYGAKKLILYDNAESPMHALHLDLESGNSELDIVPIIGDVREVSLLDYVFREYKPQIVFHAAAYKHVPLMEQNPCEAVNVNVNGTRNVADKCLEYDVEKMILVSTDKTYEPTNVLTCSMRLAEIYVQSLGRATELGKISGITSFVTVCFGNVIGSNGSVVTLFRYQIERGGPVIITDPRAVRVFMTIPEACGLVLEATSISKNGQIFFLDMGKPVKVIDLAVRMIKLAGLEPNKDIKIKCTGLRPGEKLYEYPSCTDLERTQHERLFLAKNIHYDYEYTLDFVNNLTKYATDVNVPDMIKLMKEVIPDFKSINSPFAIYDK